MVQEAERVGPRLQLRRVLKPTKPSQRASSDVNAFRNGKRGRGRILGAMSRQEKEVRTRIIRKIRKAPRTESYAVVDEVRDAIVSWAGFTPDRDAFAASANKRFPKFWDKKQDAFSQNWNDPEKPEKLWINAPFSR